MLEAPFAPLWPTNKPVVDILCYNILVAAENVLRTLNQSDVQHTLGGLAKNVLALSRHPNFPNGTEFMLSTVLKERSSRGGITAKLAQLSHAFAVSTYRALLMARERVGPELQERMESLHRSLVQHCWTIQNNRRTLFIMKGEQAGFEPQRNHDFAGFGPETVLPGDKIWIICGCSLPILLRSVEGKEGRYRVIGYGTVYGMVEGEMATADTNGNAPEACTIQLTGTRDLN